MKLSGWILMIITWTAVLTLAAFCFSRIFKKGLGGAGGKKTTPRRKSVSC